MSIVSLSDLLAGARPDTHCVALKDHRQITLARLRADGLVSTRRDGKTVYYSLASAEARVVIGAIYEVFCKKVRKR